MVMSLFDFPEDYAGLKNYKLIQSGEDIGDVLEVLDRVDHFALDTETTSLDWVVADMHGISFATEDREWYVTGGAHKMMLPALKKIVENPNKLVSMHNARYDMHILAKWGVRPVKVFDTLIAQYLVDENQRLGLKSLAYKVGVNEDLPTYKDLIRRTAKAMRMKMKDVNINMIPLNELAPYAARDTRITYDLVEVCKRDLEEEEMTELFWENEMPMMEVLLDMEERGMALDIDGLERMLIRYNDLQAEFAEKITAVGIENPNSTEQLADYLYNHLKLTPRAFTDKGSPATDIIALRRLMKYDSDGEPDTSDKTTQFLLDVLSYRQTSKILSTYVEPLLDKQHNGRIHTQFNSTFGRDKYGTVTTRLTSSDPNLQNIPAFGLGAELREMFIAPDGHTVVVIDYSQLELRIIAHYTRDKNLIRAFLDGLDPHQMTADRVGISRKHAKGVNFGWAYGIGGRGLANAIERTGMKRPNERDADKWLKGFGNAYPDAEKWKNAVVMWARKLGYVKTIDGHKRRLPDLTSHLSGERSRAERQAPNAVIQGTAASLMRHVMLRDKNELHNIFGSNLISQVHDECVWECPTEQAQEMAQAGQRIMESVEKNFDLRVPIVAEPGLGRSWGEAK